MEPLKPVLAKDEYTTEDMMDADMDASAVSDWEDQPDDYTDSELVEVSKEAAAWKKEDAPALMALAGPFIVLLNDVVDSEGRSVARCGYLHNTRASGPPMAEVVCAALNRGYRKI